MYVDMKVGWQTLVRRKLVRSPFSLFEMKTLGKTLFPKKDKLVSFSSFMLGHYMRVSFQIRNFASTLYVADYPAMSFFFVC